MTAAEQPTSAGGKIKHMLMGFVLVILVPILFASLLLGGVLQFLGVPVIKTVEHHLGLGKPVVTKAVGPTAFDLLQTERTKYQSLQREYKQEQAKVRFDAAQITTLQKEQNTLKAELSSQASAAAAAKKEGQVLVAMDPGQAAPLLAKMSVAQAAAVVAQMASTDSAPILAALGNPQRADEILADASKVLTHN